ncbi:phosphate/phosphite/phosphonate ABC transporter substrate-binding protein [Latilactobacillus curvatus]|uniref:phosphate/phosphite/phosphonate ABC transporter substrate-binding protein n=1 Tax=Latilactobacillus curvatus TaxID=28038 RepID=UPI001F4F534E|nr:phosphate/phosphite/phosphonate ABC transporter substrate-binding protein [Latilactobacillus curvatus]
MKKKLSALFALLSLLLIATLAGCSPKQSASSNGTLTMVFYPNESAKDFNASRTAIKQQIEKATGKKVKIQTTTDYNIAIEAIASGKAQLAFMGPEGYAQAHLKNKAVQPLFTLSGASGTLKDAAYHSYFMVPKEKAADYQKDGHYSIDNIKGKKISFVSVSSTSGHLIPVAAIQSKFNLKNSDELSQNGHFFKSVLFGNSHQGSAVNLYNGDADVAVFDDIDTNTYIDVSKGSWTKVGSEFRVKDDATAPFTSVHGKESIAIAISPVQNGPFVANTAKLSKDDQAKIAEAFTSKAVTDNPKILSPKGAKVPAIWKKESDKSKLLKVTNDWYAPTNKLVAKN